MVQQEGHRRGFLEIAVGDSAYLHGKSLAQIAQIKAAHQKRLVAQKFRRTVSDDLVVELCRVGYFGDQKVTGGNIPCCDADLTCIVKNAEYVVVSALIEGIHIQIGTRCDDAHHFPADNALCRAGIFHLLTDGYLVAQLHETCQISVDSVIGNTAHGSPLGKSAAFSGECQFQLAGHRHRVVKEHLVKIAQTVKEQAVGIVMLCPQIVLHHGRERRHEGGVICHDRRRRIFGVIVKVFHSVSFGICSAKIIVKTAGQNQALFTPLCLFPYSFRCVLPICTRSLL